MTGRDRRAERRARRSGEEVRERELKALKARMKAIRSVVTSKQLELLNEHFNKYPWGILKGEFVAYLFDYKVDGKSLNDELEPFMSASPNRETRDKLTDLKGYNHGQLINSLGTKIARRIVDVFVEEEFAFKRRAKGDFVETRVWEQFATSFFSKRFILGKRAKGARKGLHLRVGRGTKFFAKDIVELWARLFLEAEEDFDQLMDDRFVLGYGILKDVKGKKLTTPRDLITKYSIESRSLIRERLDELKDLGLVSITKTGQQHTFGLTKLATNIFKHLKDHMGKDEDIRKWPYRYNIIFPGAKRAPSAPAPPKQAAKVPSPKQAAKPATRATPKDILPSLLETLGHTGFLLLRVGSPHPKKVVYPFEGRWPEKDRDLRDSLRTNIGRFANEQPLRDLLALAGNLMLETFNHAKPGDTPKQVWKRIDDKMRRATFQELVRLSVYRGIPKGKVPRSLEYAKKTIAPLIKTYIGPEQAKTEYNAQDIFLRILKRMHLIGKNRK